MGGSGAETFVATLGGSGATLNGFDSLTGGDGTDTLSIFDTSTAGAMTLPTGLVLNGIEKVTVSTSANAGDATAGTTFDASSYTAVTDITVTSFGTAGDSVKAAATTNITDTNALGGVTTVGGKDVTISAKGGSPVTVGSVPTPAPTISSTTAAGAVKVTNTGATSSSSNVVVGSGTDVTVTQKGSGTVTIGGNSIDPNPTGAIAVTQSTTSGAGAISIKGGTSVSVTAAGNAVTIGGSAANSPSGAVAVTQSFKGNAGDVKIDGGSGATVTTTGGGNAGAIAIGGTTPVGRGAISVTDKYSAVANNSTYTDEISVKGGTTVSVTTTATSKDITVGAAVSGVASLLDSTGAAISATNAAKLPSGDVTVNNSQASFTRAGTASTTVGTGAINVVTNGATSVSLVGGASNAIADAKSTVATGGVNAGSAIGTSTLATVTLERSGATTIASDALTTLNVKTMATSTTGDIAIGITNNTVGHSLAVNLTSNGYSSRTGATLYEPQITDNKATSISVADAGTSSNRVSLTGSKLAAVSINNANALTLDTLSADQTNGVSVTASGAGNLTLGTTSNPFSSVTKLGSIDASAKAAGAVTVTIDGTVTSFKGGAGNDVVTVSSGIGKTIDGGAGAGDELRLNSAASTYTPILSPGAAISTLVTGFETLAVVSGASGSYNASGFSAVKNAGAASVTFDKVASATPVTISAAATSTTLTMPAGTKAADAVFNVTVSNPGTLSTTSLAAGTVVNSIAGTSSVASGAATVNLTSTGLNTSSTSTTYANTVTLDEGFSTGAATTLNIAGSSPITVTYGGTVTTSNITAVNVTGSGATNVSAVLGAASGVTYTGGAGKLTVVPGSWDVGTSSISVVSGAGGVAYTVGLGGSGGATGSEAATLTASAAKQDTITVGAESSGNGRRASLTGFVNSEASTTDYLKFSATKTPLADVTTPTTSGSTTYTVSNGVITFASVTNANTLLAQAQDIVNAAGANAVAATVLGGSTYVIASGASALTGVAGATADALVALVGVTGVKGFGTTPAENTIYTGTTVGSVTPSVALLNTGTSAASVYDAKGVSAVTLTNSSHVPTIGSTSTTLNNLAASAIITDASTSTVAKVITGQVGAAGKNSLTYNSTVAHTVSELNVSGAKSLTLNSAADTVYESIVDGGSTNTLTSITVTGASNTTLSGFTDTVLSSVSALASTGTLTLTSDKVGLSVTGSSRANTITESGANSVVSVTHNYAGGSSATTVDPQVIIANGSGASVTLSEYGAPTTGNNTYTITANGSGAIIDTSGFLVVGTTAPSITTSGGTGATITVGAGISGAVIGVNVGTGNTVNLVDGYIGSTTVPYVNINLAAATAGDISTGSYTLTKVVGATVASDTLTFPVQALANTWTAAPVNVAAATTLEAALNQAATGSGLTVGTGSIKWFQYGGDTYIVDNVAEATATTGFDASDVIVKITGLIDLSGVSVTGSGSISTLVVPLG